MTRTLAALALLSLALPPAARAQGCVGAPVPAGRHAVQLQGATSTYASTPEVEGPAIGSSLRGNPRGPLGYSAEYAYGTVGDNDLPLHSGGATISLQAPLRRLSLCARGGVMASRLADSPSASELENVTLPVGIVVELPVALGTASALVPYVAPQYLFSRTRGEVFGLDFEESGSSLGVEAGLGLRFGRAAITAGGSVSDLPDELLTPAVAGQSFFLRVGVLF